MKKQLTLAVLTASLLAGSALASDAKQDTKHLKHKHHHHAAEHAAPVAAAPVAEEAKTKYFAAEATYNWNRYKPKFSDYATTSKKYKNSGSLALGAGYAINENLKAGLMLGYVPKTSFTVNAANNNTATINVTTTKLLFVGMYDFGDMGAGVRPYVEAGIGAAYNQIKTTVNGVVTNKKPWDFAYQAGLGVSYKISTGPTISLGYRFADNGTGSKVTGISKKRLQSNEVVLGVQVPF